MTLSQFANLLGAMEAMNHPLPASDDYIPGNPNSVELEIALSVPTTAPPADSADEIFSTLHLLDRMVRSADQGSFPRNPGD